MNIQVGVTYRGSGLRKPPAPNVYSNNYYYVNPYMTLTEYPSVFEYTEIMFHRQG